MRPMTPMVLNSSSKKLPCLEIPATGHKKRQCISHGPRIEFMAVVSFLARDFTCGHPSGISAVAPPFVSVYFCGIRPPATGPTRSLQVAKVCYAASALPGEPMQATSHTEY